MIEFDEKRKKSVCITGHRTVGEYSIRQETFNHLKSLVQRGYNTFYVGMAVGFDTLCFQILEELKKENNIKIIACIPCPSQPDKFTSSQKKEYFRMIDVADEKVVLSQIYTPYCMQKRNQYMVDNSGIVLAYLRKNIGGTANTVNYAKRNDIPIIIV